MRDYDYRRENDKLRNNFSFALLMFFQLSSKTLKLTNIDLLGSKLVAKWELQNRAALFKIACCDQKDMYNDGECLIGLMSEG